MSSIGYLEDCRGELNRTSTWFALDTLVVTDTVQVVQKG